MWCLVPAGPGVWQYIAKTVPIIAMTANVFTEDIAASKAAGMNEHLAKPLDLDRIDQIMEQYL